MKLFVDSALGGREKLPASASVLSRPSIEIMVGLTH